MSGLLSLADLKIKADQGLIDTVLVCLVDMQGRLMGKRFHVSHFLENANKETHCCTYLLATDLEMAMPDGYPSANWETGYGDFAMKPDLSTLRLVPWLQGTAMVLSDVLDHNEAPVEHAPRQVLKEQIKQINALGLSPMMATELEFFIFRKSFDDIRREGYRDLETLGLYNGDYNIFQTTKEEHLMRPLRNHLVAAGVPVENSKGEAEIGQQELNIQYSDALSCADHHTIAKHACKEIAWQHGHAVSFLSKWHKDRVGSASHVHVSLWAGNENAFYDPDGEYGMSELMQYFMAGLIHYASDCMVLFAPYVNSYKRFVKATFAPTKIAWSVDNRTAGFRVCGAGTKSVRVECRIPGADINPYLTQAAMLAAGIRGIKEQRKIPPAVLGDMYENESVAEIPKSLHEAIPIFRRSSMLREAMGNNVVDHYTRCAEWEQEEFDRAITNWEIERGFE